MDVTISQAAELDLEDIALYIAQDNPMRALTFTDELQVRAKGLVNAPFKGTERNHLASGLRLLPHGNYNIFYWIRTDEIVVVRIMHSAQDIGPEDFA